MKKKILFIYRDNILIKKDLNFNEIDSIEKISFYPEVIFYISRIFKELDYELVMITNSYKTDKTNKKNFIINNYITKIFNGENISISKIEINENNIKELEKNIFLHYLSKDYDINNSLLIVNKVKYIFLAKKIGCKVILMNNINNFIKNKNEIYKKEIKDIIILKTTLWKKIYKYLRFNIRSCEYKRSTKETNIEINIKIDGTGLSNIETGLFFFNHMLNQISIHGEIDLYIKVKGDLLVDEHHTIEDTGIALGKAFLKALGNKRGIDRYGFTLPMDDSLSQVTLDLGGRNYIVWNVNFCREKIGDVPTEMFYHFFKSFSDGAKCNINISSNGINEHHKIESIFKAFAKSLKMASNRNYYNNRLPTTKGVL